MDRRAIEETYAFCPQCGTSNERLGEIPYRCESCGFVCFFGPVAAVGGLVVNKQRQLLFVRRARNPGKGKWGLPGGFVDRGESVEDALRREIEEETGLRVTRAKYFMSAPNQYEYHGIVAPVIDLFYECRVDMRKTVNIALEELEHFEWSEPTPELLDNMAFESNRRAVEAWQRIS